MAPRLGPLHDGKLLGTRIEHLVMANEYVAALSDNWARNFHSQLLALNRRERGKLSARALALSDGANTTRAKGDEG